jgi:hypothetical protein
MGFAYVTEYHILDLATRRRQVVSSTPPPLYPQYPLDKRLGGLRSRSRCCGKEKNCLPLQGIEPQPYST